MGVAPDYYALISSARYLGVAPWDLAGLPETAGAYCWIVWGIVCAEGEASAQQQINRHAQARSRITR